MKATRSTLRPNQVPTTPDAQAAALWMFVHSNAPRFTLGAARDVVKSLGFREGEELKPLAKRLVALLAAQRVNLKHTNALQLAARLSGFTSWYGADLNERHRLKFVTLDSDQVSESAFANWDDLANELRFWTDRLIARGQLPLGVLTLKFTGNVLHLNAPIASSEGTGTSQNEAWPLGAVTSVFENDIQWLDGALTGLEKLRRHLEENNHAVLDGYAVLRLCATSQDEPGHPMGVNIADVVNSELVLLREDDEGNPSCGYEIARGDELSCWHQFELSMQDDSSGILPEFAISIPAEGSGAWYVDGARYIWVVETLKPKAYVPGRVSRQIGIVDCERLLRRYSLARRIHGASLKNFEPTKRGDYLGAPPETYRVNLQFLRRQLTAAELTWEGFLTTVDAGEVAITDELPIGLVCQFLDELHVAEPNRIFALPTVDEMAKVEDDGLLRALMPRVEHVTYIAPAGLVLARASELQAIVEEFAVSLRAHKMLAGGRVNMKNELPHLVWATDAEELRLAAAALGLTIYAAVIPHLIPIEGLMPQLVGVKTWPWAFGNSMFLRFVDVAV